VDCVKLAVNEILKENQTSAFLVNHGSNSSINVIYSGTMSAAVKQVLRIPAIGCFWIMIGMRILKQ
jgi:5'-nucleotidase